jgi:hypothetical protein
MSKEFILQPELLDEMLKTTKSVFETLKKIKEQKASHQPIEDKKEWEILEYGGLWNSETGNEIKKVKRLSDGVVFSVGDEVYYDESGNAGLSFYTWKIDNFYIRSDGVMLARSKNEGMVETIDKNCYLKNQNPILHQ